jgi:hypothetical protein
VKRAVTVVVAAFGMAFAACGKSAGDGQTAADTLTRRQRDSIISTLPIPGAGGVGRALGAQDAARARADALDSIR